MAVVTTEEETKCGLIVLVGRISPPWLWIESSCVPNDKSCEIVAKTSFQILNHSLLQLQQFRVGYLVKRGAGNGPKERHAELRETGLHVVGHFLLGGIDLDIELLDCPWVV